MSINLLDPVIICATGMVVFGIATIVLVKLYSDACCKLDRSEHQQKTSYAAFRASSADRLVLQREINNLRQELAAAERERDEFADTNKTLIQDMVKVVQQLKEVRDGVVITAARIEAA